METFSRWQLVRNGFWVGIGFLVPFMVLGFAALTAVGYAVKSFDPEAAVMEQIASPNFDFDDTEGLELGAWRTTPHGNRLLILGSVTNSRETEVGSVQIEAELFDADGTYVYECSTYISQDLAPGATENFQIRCGCKEEPMPEYATIELRIVSASAF